MTEETKKCGKCKVSREVAKFLSEDGTREYKLCSKCREGKREREQASRQAAGATLRISIRVDDSGRECTSCHDYKPWEHYASSATGSHGKEARCRECKSDYDRA